MSLKSTIRKLKSKTKELTAVFSIKSETREIKYNMSRSNNLNSHSMFPKKAKKSHLNSP